MRLASCNGVGARGVDVLGAAAAVAVMVRHAHARARVCVCACACLHVVRDGCVRASAQQLRRAAELPSAARGGPQPASPPTPYPRHTRPPCRYGAQLLSVLPSHGLAAYGGHHSAVVVCLRTRAVLHVLGCGLSK